MVHHRPGGTGDGPLPACPVAGCGDHPARCVADSFCAADGFDNFGPHNLITFKSNQDTLDTWALDELVGHYVNYRKQARREHPELLLLDQFRLYAVCVRVPQLLQRPDVERVAQGV
jgi:hypothetical protein